MILIAFAFLAGIVTILSPCILPVLPLVLGGTAGQGRLRPWGIVAGFIGSFTLFTLTLSSLVQTLNLPPDLLRWVAAGLVAVFGIVLVVPQFKDAFLALATRLVSRSAPAPVGFPAAASRWGGLVPGLLLGFSLGVVWTPCVGPIMASVISLSLTQTVTSDSVLITLAYACGTAVPLLAILLGGRRLLQRFPFLVKSSGAVQRVFGGLMLLTAVALLTGADRQVQVWVQTTFPQYGTGLTALEDQSVVREELAKLEPTRASTPVAQPLSLASGAWINSPPLSLDGLKGKVVLLDFWTYSCVNCVRTLPYLRAWYEKYKGEGLVIVGVHSPEFAFERSEANVRQAVKDLGVTWPVVQDNAFGIWNAYQNKFWPSHYLYGRDGELLETHSGEGGYAETEALIVRALGLRPTAGASPASMGTVAGAISVSSGPLTPETYLGYARGARFASPQDVAADSEAQYSLPTTLATDEWALAGRWTIGSEASTATKGARLLLHFQGQRVYLVLRPVPGEAAHITVKIGGRPANGGDVHDGVLTLDKDRLYQVVDQTDSGEGLLELEMAGQVAVYAFTFG